VIKGARAMPMAGSAAKGAQYKGFSGWRPGWARVVVETKVSMIGGGIW